MDNIVDSLGWHGFLLAALVLAEALVLTHLTLLDEPERTVGTIGSPVPDKNPDKTYLDQYKHPAEGSLEAVLEPNTEAMITEGGRLPGYVLETNSKGFREEEFRANNTEPFRIVFLGDSQTLGWGVNRSERYTDIVERRLDRRYQRDVQVLNLAIPAYGLENFYRMMKYRGLEYDPDVVVVAFGSTSILSYSDQEAINNRVNEIAGSDVNNSRRMEIYRRVVKDRADRVLAENEGRYWLSRLEKLSDNETRLLLYNYGHRRNSSWMADAERAGLDIRWGPELNVSHIISRSDPHFNQRGHLLQARRVMEILRPHLDSLT